MTLINPQSDPIQSIPASVRDRIWNCFSLSDLSNVQLVSKCWHRWSQPRYRKLALIRLNPTPQNQSQLANYVAKYGNYRHQCFEINTIFLHADCIQDYINISMSMEFITQLFEQYAEHVRRLVFNHRSHGVQLESNKLKEDQVEEFLWNVFSHCPDVENLKLDLINLKVGWFPENRVFLNLKTLEMDSFHDLGDEFVMAATIMEATPNLERFITKALRSQFQARLMGNMAQGFEDNDRCWPRFISMEVRDINFDSPCHFVKKFRELNRPMKALYLGNIGQAQMSSVFGILETFKNTLEDVHLTVIIETGFRPARAIHIPKMQKLQSLRFVVWSLDLQRTGIMTRDSDDAECSSSLQHQNKIRKQNGVNTRAIVKREGGSDFAGCTKEMMDFCNLSEIFAAKSKLEERLPQLHTLQLTFKSGFREIFYNYYFPALLHNQSGVQFENFPQISTLVINYPNEPWDSECIARILSFSKLFPNVHNRQFNYARQWGAAAAELIS